MIDKNTAGGFFAGERKPADLVFAIIFLLLSLFLLSQIGNETHWVKRSRLFAQPAFWPAVGLIGMTLFAFLHFLGSIYSHGIEGRATEVLLWLRSLEFAAWFMAYVWIVPYSGYLIATLVFTVSLSYRLGYRTPRTLLSAAAMGVLTVIVFKSILAVKIPGGAIYEYLPDGIRNFMLVYL